MAKVLSAQTLDYGMVDAAAVRVKASNIPLVVGFKATRTELCWLSYALLSVAMHAVEDGNMSSCVRALVSHEVGNVAMLPRWRVLVGKFVWYGSGRQFEK